MSAKRGWLASRKRRWALIGGVLAIGWLVSHRYQQRPEVQVATATEGPLKLTIAASGRVEGSSAELGFNDTGSISELYVKEGQQVGAHRTLARIRRTLATGLESPGADVIQAPFDGTVVQIYRYEGSVVQPGIPVLRLVRSDGAWVTAFLDSEDAAWLHVGDSLEARAGGFLARPWTLRVEAIGAEAVVREDIPGSSKQVRVKLRVTGGGFDLPVGTSLDIDGHVPMVAKALLIPVAAVIRKGGDTHVWRVVDNAVERVEVRTGANNLRQIVIASGLRAGDRVVVEGKPELKAGTRVRTKSWEGQDGS